MATRPLVFLDASVLVAASRSRAGGSAVAMKVCRGRRFQAALTTRVLLEARRNVARKFGHLELLDLYHDIASLNPVMAPPPSARRIAECVPLTTEKDAHVLAAALECDAAYLLTFDRRHLLTATVLAANLPVRVLTPGDFLDEVVSQESR